MKPKIYPQTILNAEDKFIRDYLFNEKQQLKSAAIAATPEFLKHQIIEAARRRGLISSDIRECIFWIVHNLTKYPKICKTCTNPITKFHSFSTGYPHSRCSTKCSNGDKNVQNKKKGVSQQKFGKDFHFQSEVIKKKIRNKLIDRLAVSKNTVQKLIEQQGFSVLNKGETFSDIWTLQCKCSKEFDLYLSTWSKWNTNWKTICPACSKGSSSQEKEVAKFIEDLGFIIEQRNRTYISPLEIDIFIPSLQLAIEFNGLYWHSDDKYRHLKKLEACKNVNIKLIQIFDHEWVNKQEIIKSRIKNALGLNSKIFARNTKIVEISSKEAQQFFIDNHLQGNADGGKYFFALMYNNELVHIMSFCKSRFSKCAQIELLRSASKQGITVVGGVSKLIKHARKILNMTIITYADRCWGEGESYIKAGGEFIGVTPPSYFWWKGNQIVSRYASQKKNLHKLIGNSFDTTLSEQQIMRQNGWRQLWNAGNTVYIFK